MRCRKTRKQARDGRGKENIAARRVTAYTKERRRLRWGEKQSLESKSKATAAESVSGPAGESYAEEKSEHGHSLLKKRAESGK